jgi:hypothetical protein
MTPVPLSGTNVGVLGALESILIAVDFAPPDVGEKAAWMLQFSSADIVGVRLGQGFGPPPQGSGGNVATLNITASPPSRVMELMIRSVVPGFDMVKTCGSDELPAFTLPKL